MARRALETVAANIAVFLPLFLVIFSYPFLVWSLYYGGFFRLFSILYFIYFIFDWNTMYTGKDNGFLLGSSFVKLIQSYFSMSMITTSPTPYPLDKNYLVGGHPHGFLSFGQLARMDPNSDEYKKIFGDGKYRFCCTDLSFKIPFLRDIFLGLGGMSVGSKAIKSWLGSTEKGRFLNIMIGGIREGLIMSDKEHRLILKSRKGFIRMALTTGSYLIPSYTFGETEIWDLPKPHTDSQKSQIISRGIPLLRRCFIPKKVAFTLVLGSAIPVEKVANPTQEQIDEVHDKYLSSLTEMFNLYRDMYSNIQSELIIE